MAYNKNIDKGIRAEINTFLKALENEPKDTPPTNPTGGTSKPNLDSNTLKGNGFITYPNSAKEETAIKQNFNVQEWVKNMSDVLSDEWSANLTKLAKKHPEMFKSEADVFRVIKEIKDNPTHFFKNDRDDVALIGKTLNSDKDGNIGIVKESGEIIHANKNRSGDLERLKRKQIDIYKKDGAIAGTPAPATTRPNNGVDGEIIQNRTDETIIPNQTIKQAETTKNKNELLKPRLFSDKNKLGKDTPDNPLSLYSKNIYNFKDDIQNKINQLKKVENSPDKMIVKKGDGFENITETTTLKDAKIQLKKAQAKLANYLNNGNWLNDEITDLQQILELKTPFKLGYTADKEAIDLLCADHRVTKSSVTNTITKQRNTIEKYLNITPIKEFGTNYAEFYHDGSNAIKKLLIEKQGQVAGAFEKEGKDITLVWGIEGTSHSDGYGLSKIAKYHPEAVDNLDNIISKGEFYKDEKGRLNIKYNDDIVGLRENWLGNETVPWIISSYTKKAETSKGFNSASSITPSKENYSFTTQHNNIIPQNTKFDNTPTFLNKYPKLIDDLKWDKTLKFSSAPKSKEELKARQAFLNEFKILSSKEKIDIKI
ncbi:hypothetical protein CFT13S00388_09010 [Campylobacter fetus subsp. testudinum]|uniref:putative barnase/colicin E5 family endoribonuclease n=1 Tax=Campylobacter fetus TaxID=196 RepID=UPI000818967E|nr:hypothetical protein [Campylobacter fetus]MPB72136.1 hypothetical protein [Campylobacter fetus]MPB77339.1 hypothetical protein [Campylobacter fetus]OCR86466.1 hypothetical protein CFT13S00388_09010 [Campylobacter fetus subsp. testudinum]OCS02406.1 hypothetical protein CFTCF782_08990 [Campylobacter fetus subsp. testudinum]